MSSLSLSPCRNGTEPASAMVSFRCRGMKPIGFYKKFGSGVEQLRKEKGLSYRTRRSDLIATKSTNIARRH